MNAWRGYGLLAFALWVAAVAGSGAAESSGSFDLTADERAWLEGHRRIPVLVDGDWPPIDYIDGDGNHQGVSAAYLRLIGQRLGIRFEPHPEPDFPSMLKAVRDGAFALAASIVDTSERRKFLHFSNHYLYLHRNIVTRRGSAGIRRLEDLDGRTVAVEKEVFTHHQLQREYPGIHLKLVADTAAALKAVSWGQADAYVGNREAAAWLIRQLGLRNLHFSGDVDEGPAELAFALPRHAEWRPLAELIDKALASIGVDERRRIETRWLASASPSRDAPNLPLSESEQRWIGLHPVIRLGVDADWPPVEFQRDGEYLGLSADYVKLFNRQLGLNMQPVENLTWNQVMRRIETGDIDVIPAIVPLEAWRDRLLFTEPYLSFPFVIFTRTDAGIIRGLQDLAGGRVVVEESTAAKALLQRDYPDIPLLVVETTAEAVETLSEGRADAFIGNLITGRFIAQQRGFSNIRVAAPTPYHYDLAFGVRKDWPELRDMLQRAIEGLSAARKRTFSARWLNLHADAILRRHALRRQFWSILAIAAPILLLLLAWALTMRHRKNCLLASEQRFHRAMEAVSEGVWEWNLKTNERYFSPGFFHRLGYVDDEIPRDDAGWHMLIHPDDRALRLQRLAQLASLGEEDAPTRMEYRLRRRDGDWVPILAEGRVARRDAGGRALTRVGTLRDMSSLKQAQADIRRLTRALEDNPLLIVIIDPDKRIEYANGRIGEILGYRPDEVIGQPVAMFLSPNADAERLASLRRALDAGERWNGELLHRRRNGEEFWMAVSVSPIFDEHGGISHYVGTDEDISARKAVEEVLKRSEQQLQEIIDAIPLAIVVVALDGRIIKANPQAAREVSEADSIVGRHMLDFYANAEDRARFIAEMQRNGQVHGMHVVYRTDWGEPIDGLVSVIPIQYCGEPARLGVMLNLTERVSLEKALAEAKVAAESANRLKSRFLANMSHEIRTPMNAVIGLSHLALRTELDTQQRDYLEKIAASGQALLGLINDILDLSRIEAGRIEIDRGWFSLNEVLASVAGMSGLKAAGKGLELLLTVACDVPDRLLGDPLRLGQILTNLVQNAIKYTDAGEVLVQVELARRHAAHARLRIIVSDSGSGIALEDQANLFDAFTQVDQSMARRHGGVGLGLAICKSLVELMDGDIRVRSWPGLGSSFSVELPFEVGEEESPPCRPVAAFQGQHALVVDDNPIAAAILVNMLESIGVHAEAASDGERALARVADALAVGTPFELYLLDWRLPGIDGVETARRITRLLDGGDALMIMVTAFGQREPELWAGGVGWDGFLSKPYSRHQLIDILLAAWRGGEADTPSVLAGAWTTQRLIGEVLVVEDNPINQQVVRELLENMGLTVSIAGSGETALSMLAERRWELILMDVEMPGIDGFETTRRIHDQDGSAAIPIVAMTAHAISGDRERCLRAGMDAYLSKPIDPYRLFDLLAGLLPRAVEKDRESAARAEGGSPLAPLPGLDCHAGLVQTGRNQALYHRLLGEFAVSHAEDGGRLRDLLGGDVAPGVDIVGARRLLHTLNGVAAHLGAMPLSRLARRFESRLKHGDVMREDDLARFDRVLWQAVDSARQCTERAVSSALENPSVAATVWELNAITELDRLIRAGSVEALTALDDIVAGDVPEALREAFLQLREHLRNYDFNEASERLAGIRDSLGFAK